MDVGIVNKENLIEIMALLGDMADVYKKHENMASTGFHVDVGYIFSKPDGDKPFPIGMHPLLVISQGKEGETGAEIGIEYSEIDSLIESLISAKSNMAYLFDESEQPELPVVSK